MSQGERKGSITQLRKWNLVAGGSDPRNDVIPASVGYGLEDALDFAMSEILRLQDRCKRLEEAGDVMERDALKADVVRLTLKVTQLYEGTEEQRQRINRLEDIINRAHLAFFSDSSDRKVSIAMHRILDEEVRKEAKP